MSATAEQQRDHNWVSDAGSFCQKEESIFLSSNKSNWGHGKRLAGGFEETEKGTAGTPSLFTNGGRPGSGVKGQDESQTGE